MAQSGAESTRRYRERHPDRVAACLKAYRINHRDKINEGQRRRAAPYQAYIDSHKVGGCVDCGNKNLTVLELDHVRGQKNQDVAQMLRGFTFSDIDDEAAKCDVRCANCHRIVTAKRRLAKRAAS